MSSSYVQGDPTAIAYRRVYAKKKCNFFFSLYRSATVAFDAAHDTDTIIYLVLTAAAARTENKRLKNMTEFLPIVRPSFCFCFSPAVSATILHARTTMFHLKTAISS
jgi:hypothetical protein